MKNTKYIFITGGVVSSLGKGITSASLGCILSHAGLKVNMIKMDPYLNVDPGTMSPFQHGEVFVTADGSESDLDLGHYERFLNKDMSRKNSTTSGEIYSAVISRERKGGYLGSTIQVIPHITDEIKSRLLKVARGSDIVIAEIGGTVGDIESHPFLEAIRQMARDKGRENVAYIHLTLVPYIRAAQELKTKPTQQSVAKLREIGIEPDMIMARSEKALTKQEVEKISLFCSVQEDYVIQQQDVDSTVYEVPLMLQKQKVDEKLFSILDINRTPASLSEWKSRVENIKKASKKLNIGIAGKYTELRDAYISIVEALRHCAGKGGWGVSCFYIDIEGEGFEKELNNLDGIIVPGGFGERGIEQKIEIVRLSREKDIPFFGICLGFQCMVIDYARNVAGLKNADSLEFNSKTPHPVIALSPGQEGKKSTGGTMRLGNFKSILKNSSIAARAYGRLEVEERHRHRYEFNKNYLKRLKETGLVASGEAEEGGLVEIMEVLNKRWFLGCQFHPEFSSSLLSPNPLFYSFYQACSDYRKEKER